MCVCCQELVYQPVTTECFHNVCKVSSSPAHLPCSDQKVDQLPGLFQHGTGSRIPRRCCYLNRIYILIVNVYFSLNSNSH